MCLSVGVWCVSVGVCGRDCVSVYGCLDLCVCVFLGVCVLSVCVCLSGFPVMSLAIVPLSVCPDTKLSTHTRPEKLTERHIETLIPKDIHTNTYTCT